VCATTIFNRPLRLVGARVTAEFVDDDRVVFVDVPMSDLFCNQGMALLRPQPGHSKA
jgi:hypothetical protein